MAKVFHLPWIDTSPSFSFVLVFVFYVNEQWHNWSVQYFVFHIWLCFCYWRAAAAAAVRSVLCVAFDAATLLRHFCYCNLLLSFNISQITFINTIGCTLYSADVVWVYTLFKISSKNFKWFIKTAKADLGLLLTTDRVCILRLTINVLELQYHRYFRYLFSIYRVAQKK